MNSMILMALLCVTFLINRSNVGDPNTTNFVRAPNCYYNEIAARTNDCVLVRRVCDGLLRRTLMLGEVSSESLFIYLLGEHISVVHWFPEKQNMRPIYF